MWTMTPRSSGWRKHRYRTGARGPTLSSPISPRMRRVRSPERVAQALAVLCLVILAVLAGKPSFTNASQPPRGIRDPMIALQMARDAGEVDAILGESPGPDR